MKIPVDITYFNPTEEDLIKHYLLKKISGERTDVELKVINLLTVEPSDIPHICKSGIAGTNRSTAKGNWRTTGNDKEIYTDSRVLIGMRKMLSFYQGKSSSGKITNGLFTSTVLKTMKMKDLG
jgi:hypothetical protein